MTKQTSDTDIETTSSPEIPGAQALVRGLDVLMAVGNSSGAMKFKELQIELQIPKGSLHRVLAALQSRQLVRYDERSKVYTLGSKVMDLARRTIDQSPIIKSCKPELLRLSRTFRRAVCLYLLDGDEVFVLEYENPDASQARVVTVWPRLRADSSSAGISILSQLKQVDRAKSFPSLDESQESNISLSQALGYSILTDTYGSTTIASAILDSSGHPIGAICCHYGLNHGKPENLHSIGRMIADSTNRASGNIEVSNNQNWRVCSRPKTTSEALVLQDFGRDFMGENPFWSPKNQTLYWLDILAPALRWLNPSSGKSGRLELSDLFGGFTFTHDDRIILAGRKGIFELNISDNSTNLLLNPENDKPYNRFNTVSVDKDGSMWAGTMSVDNKGGIGSLYKIDSDFKTTKKLPKVFSPKNIAWSPNGDEIYFTEGKVNTLYAYDPKSMNNKKRRIIVEGTPEIGMPNGITVDSEGAIWVAMLGGWSIRRYWPDGTLDKIIYLPVPMPTNLIFGGPELKTLYITSTYLRVPPGILTEAPHSGSILTVDTEVKGLPVNFFGYKQN